MEHIKALENLLGEFPVWQGESLQVDDTTPAYASCGLFPRGERELSRREDITGNLTLRMEQSFLLRRVAPRGQEAAAWLLQLQSWLSGKTLPAFGSNSCVRAQGGRLAKPGAAGGDIYELTITVEYTKEKKYGEN